MFYPPTDNPPDMLNTVTITIEAFALALKVVDEMDCVGLEYKEDD